MVVSLEAKEFVEGLIRHQQQSGENGAGRIEKESLEVAASYFEDVPPMAARNDTS
jgi:hypothetical protein